MPLPWRQRAGREKGVSHHSSSLGLCGGSQPHHRLGEQALSTRDVLCWAGHCLARLTWSSQPQPLCFPRPWQLILCSSCAAVGTHRRCSHLSNTRATWECNSCAGLGTGKRQSAMWHHAGARHGLAATARGGFARVCLPQENPLRCCSFIFMPFLPLPAASSANTEIAGPSTASQGALEPASGSMEPQNISSMPASQAALGTSQSSQLPEHSDLPSVPETEQGTNGTRSSEDRATPEQLRGRRGSRRTAAPRAESDSHAATRRRASGSSRASPAAARRRRRRQRSGRSRTRSRSPLQRRDPSSQSRPRRRHGSRRRPASREQSGTRRSTRSATSRSPMASRVPRRRGPSRQGGRALSQSPPPGRRRANNSRSSPQRGSRSRAQQRRPSRE